MRKPAAKPIVSIGDQSTDATNPLYEGNAVNPLCVRSDAKAVSDSESQTQGTNTNPIFAQ